MAQFTEESLKSFTNLVFGPFALGWEITADKSPELWHLKKTYSKGHTLPRGTCQRRYASWVEEKPLFYRKPPPKLIIS